MFTHFHHDTPAMYLYKWSLAYWPPTPQGFISPGGCPDPCARLRAKRKVSKRMGTKPLRTSAGAWGQKCGDQKRRMAGNIVIFLSLTIETCWPIPILICIDYTHNTHVEGTCQLRNVEVIQELYQLYPWNRCQRSFHGWSDRLSAAYVAIHDVRSGVTAGHAVAATWAMLQEVEEFHRQKGFLPSGKLT